MTADGKAILGIASAVVVGCIGTLAMVQAPSLGGLAVAQTILAMVAWGQAIVVSLDLAPSITHRLTLDHAIMLAISLTLLAAGLLYSKTLPKETYEFLEISGSIIFIVVMIKVRRGSPISG